MSARSFLLMAILAAFGALTTLAIYENGYWGIIAFHFPSSAGWQVLTDLVIVCALAMVWMVTDARKTGRNAWPFVVITLFLGSFGPLLYLLLGELRQQQRAVMA